MFENAVAEAGQRIVVGMDPERPIRTDEQSSHARLLEFGRVDGIERDEAHAIESRETIVCSDPKITIGRLGYRGDRTVRQPVVSRPDVDQIISGSRGVTWNPNQSETDQTPEDQTLHCCEGR